MFATLPRTSYGTSWTCIKPANFVSWITDKASQMCNCDCNFLHKHIIWMLNKVNETMETFSVILTQSFTNDEYKWLMHTCLPPQMSNVHKHTTLGMYVGIKKDPACSTSNWWLIQLLHGTERIYIRVAASQELVPSGEASTQAETVLILWVRSFCTHEAETIRNYSLGVTLDR